MNKVIDEMNPKAFIYGSIFTIANKLQKLGNRVDPKIPTKQWFVLAIMSQYLQIKAESPTLGNIAEMSGTSYQNVKKIAVSLEGLGFIEIKKDEKDARILRLSLTPTCLEYFKKREKVEEDYLKEIFEGFDESKIVSLQVELKRLYTNIEKMERNYEESKK